MADDTPTGFTTGVMGRLRASPLLTDVAAIAPAGERMLTRAAIDRRRLIPRPPLPTPAPAPAPAPAPPALRLPEPSPENVFMNLPFPSPGDRIRADDFKTLAQALRAIYDAHVLAGALCGVTFAEARTALATHRYQIVRVMTVFGNVLGSPDDPSFDAARVLQVWPAVLGDRNVTVIVSEAIETRRFAPNLVGLNYAQAMDQLRTVIGSAAMTGAPVTAPDLNGRTLAEASQAIGAP
jgi:hypothetical protein